MPTTATAGAIITALALSACGAASSGSGSASKTPQHGKQIFTSAGCAGCHTLSAAGASGTVGPNLDTLKPSDAAVIKQVTNGGGGMPAFKGNLSSTQIDSVARFVSTAVKGGHGG